MLHNITSKVVVNSPIPKFFVFPSYSIASFDPKKKHNEETSANLTRAEPGEYSREAGVSKDTPGPESPGELQRSWYVEGHLGYEGVSSREAKLTHIFTKIETKNKADSQSPDEEVKGINSNSRETSSVTCFEAYPIIRRPCKKDTTKLTVPTGKGMMLVGNKDAEKLDPTRSVRRETTVGMIRGKTNQKRPYEQAEQWINNEISFPFVPGCQLVDSPIILEALIKDFQVLKIYVDKGSSSEVNYPIGLRSSSLHHSLNDKVPYEQRNRNDDDQERNPSGVPEDRRSARTGIRYSTKGQKTEKNKQNQAREWKEYEKLKPKAYTSLMGQPEPILLGQATLAILYSPIGYGCMAHDPRAPNDCLGIGQD
ncbi:hypothetical protein Tco_0705470 [Tanacetum coccineum]|uniref:Uncharacterized protein n=1 Tax=Tanacetum coccineum TaxID=301880 RepID=A0ABQ4Y4P7_9ASTR